MAIPVESTVIIVYDSSRPIHTSSKNALAGICVHIKPSSGTVKKWLSPYILDKTQHVLVVSPSLIYEIRLGRSTRAHISGTPLPILDRSVVHAAPSCKHPSIMSDDRVALIPCAYVICKNDKDVLKHDRPDAGPRAPSN